MPIDYLTRNEARARARGFQKKSLRRVMIAVSLLCAAESLAVPMPTVKLYEFKTPNYTLVMESAQQAPMLLEKVAALERLLPTLVDHDDSGDALPTCIFVFPSLHWREYLDPDESSSGFLPSRFSNLILIDGTVRGGGLRRVAFGNYTRAYLRARYPRQYPFWFEMGLSSLMSTATLDDRTARLGADPFRRNENEAFFSGSFWFDPSEIGTNLRVPLGRLLRLEPESTEYADAYSGRRARQQSWRLVHRGIVSEPEFGARFSTYFASRERMQSVDEALHQAFNTDAVTLDAEMAAYEKRKVIATRDFSLPPSTGSPKLVPSRRMNEGEALVLLARAMLDGGMETPRIARLIEGAAQIEGDTTGVRALWLRLAARYHDDTMFLKLITATGDSHLQGLPREAALAVVERLYSGFPNVDDATVDLQMLREHALTLLGQAAASPADVEAAWGYALLAADLERDLPQAHAAISAAREQRPRSPDLALAAARVNEALGDSKAARKDLVAVFRFSRNVELRAWAAERIDELATPTP